MKYRKKPVVIEAIRWDGKNFGQVELFGRGFRNISLGPHMGEITISTLEGDMVAKSGDWIIKGVMNEFYPCKPDIFEATYEKVG